MGSFVNDIKYKTTTKVYDVDSDIIVNVDIIFYDVRKFSEELSIFLAILIVLCEIFECKKDNIVTRSLKKCM